MPGTMQGRRRNQGMIDWLTEEGLADDFFKNFDWDNLDYANITQDIINKLEAPTREFFLRHTKVELLEGAVKHRIFFYPQFTTTDLLESVQLEARGYWVEIEHPELNMTIKYPGAFAVLSETPIRPSLRAPHLGEHNREVYGELGIPAEEIETLKQTKVI
jgi:crotonobetainyl-CoA:carnitine CoA-transferase CaiB-like acyl-CoA transferase